MSFAFRNILLCLRWGIGDVVMQSPLLGMLRRAAPDARVTALGAAPATELLRGDRRVDEVEAVQQFGVRHLWDDVDATGVRAWLDEQRFDLILDPHAASSALKRVLWNVPSTFRESDQAQEQRVLQRGGNGAEALIAGAAAGWGVPLPVAPHPSLSLSANAYAEADAQLRALIGDGMPAPIAVAPFASLPLKRWPLDRFVRAAGAVAHRSGRPLVVLAAPGCDSAGRLHSALPSRLGAQLVAPRALDVLAALLTRCAALLCNDTGVMHIAAAVGTPAVSLFGPTDPSVYAPHGTMHRSLGGRNIVCAHRPTGALAVPECWNTGACLLPQRSCIDAIEVDHVVRAFDGLGAALR